MVSFLSFMPYLLVAGLDQAGIHQPAKILHYVFCVINPAYGVYGGLHYIGQASLVFALENKTPTVSDYYDPDLLILPTILIMICQSILAVSVFSFLYYRQQRVEAPEEHEDGAPLAEVQSASDDDPLGPFTRQ